MPDVLTKLVNTGKLRIVYHDFPLDAVALEAAMIARWLPAAQYFPFCSALFASQDTWAFAPGINYTDQLWKMAALAGMSRSTFDHAIADNSLKNWIQTQQVADEKMYNIEATPTFLINGKAQAGDMDYTTFVFGDRTDWIMAARLARLRIAGFKSFADTTSLDILPGLTGIIGPNGCGKSNIVEALRWAMGEGSARSLRGGEMDDIIFAGTTARPSRNIAEVTVTLEEAAGIVPPPHHEQAELEITRKIERGAGSNYRVNGREVRARDVQTLFADLASGARSCAMVGQGRVAAIVGAKPEERRQILEEAAGIAGLSARRHEAELKLRATETNLQRAEDMRGQVEAQLQGLQRQARQAARYRNISGLIRAAEAEFLAIQYLRAERNRAEAHGALASAQAAVAEAAAAVRAAEQAHGGSDDILPPLRAAEADARTALERQRVAAEQLAAEEDRARAAIGAATQRLEQATRDLDRARVMMRDAAEAEQRLAAEDATLAEAETDSKSRLLAAATAMHQAADAARAAEAVSQQALERNAALAAQSQALTQRLTQAEQRARRLAEQVTRLVADRDRLAADLVSPEKLEEARAAVTTAEAARHDAAARLEAAERERVAAQSALTAARDRANATEAAATKLRAEIRALNEVLSVGGSQTGPEMVDALTVPRRLGSRTRRGTGRGAQRRHRPSGRAALARTAACRSRHAHARGLHAARRPGAGAARTDARLVSYHPCLCRSRA